MKIKHIAVALFFIMIVTALSACSDKPKPEDRFQSYVDLWQKQDFDKMYSYLSADAKKSISKKKFTERYKDIYGGIEAKNLKVSFKKPKDEVKPDKNGNVKLPFKVSMETLAGPVKFTEKATLVEQENKDKKNWYINWSPAMIFPKLNKGDKVRVETLEGKRGEIVDRNEKGLAMNGVAAQIGLVPGKLGSNPDATKSKLASLLNIPEQQIENKLGASWVKADSFVPVTTINAADTELINKAVALPGVRNQNVEARIYPCKEACAHLTGYVGPITKELLEKKKDKGYNSESVIGRKGLELVLEDQLRARNGGIIYIENTDGDKTATIAKKAPKNGKDFRLSIDINVQKALYNQLKKDAGTAAAINPSTGDILGLVSAPSFDPNAFVLGISSDDYQKLSSDPKKPLLNRFTGTFTPGSSFKPITAAIGLETGAIDPDAVKTINSSKWQKDSSWGDYYVTRLDHASKVDLKEALVRSDNIYFAQAALAIGGKTFMKEAKKYGFGESLPIKYPMEKSTVTNSGALDKEVLLANTGYGQGQVNVNPLHLAVIYSAFVDEGNMIKPHLFYSDTGKPEYWKEGVMSPKTASTITKDLIQVIESPAGTAKHAKIDGVTLAGKTGTAEFKSKQGEKGKEDGWFVAYNTKNPSLLVSMMVENVKNGEGSHYVAPKVKNVFEKVLKK
ncbi:penicillin-binding protein [Scopulibacillus darangshiensis]|uniref:Penicillin-binding protein n=1 Tax=Scopulibacillus darangshiensis TaxID=442528 RepID=A0A4R2NI43_9BACL|nr:penicillin-binding transpeptidase domain-containing protein [Scopulibacillus darangshiensis]TCP20855.1 penicillin-binding protein [Scopulibacillus darangshiensis]